MEERGWNTELTDINEQCQEHLIYQHYQLRCWKHFTHALSEFPIQFLFYYTFRTRMRNEALMNMNAVLFI